jgi:ATP/maltotriose-dependent transcriptional regulator MalT
LVEPYIIVDGKSFTEREAQILDALVNGLSNQEIADSVGIAVKTLEKYLSNSSPYNAIYPKIGVKNKREAGQWWKKHTAQIINIGSANAKSLSEYIEDVEKELALDQHVAGDNLGYEAGIVSEAAIIPLAEPKPESSVELFDIELLPDISSFRGRSSDARKCNKILHETGVIAIHGVAGVGKTWLGVQLAQQQMGMNSFWFTFRAGISDKIEDIIWALGAFLAQKGESGLWRIMRDQKPYPLSVKLNQLIQSLKRFPCLLCFDDFQVVHNNQEINSFFAHLLAYHTKTAPASIKLLIIGFEKPEFVATDTAFELKGFSKVDVRQWLSDVGLQLSEVNETMLLKQSEGNAIYLSSFIRWATEEHRSKSAIKDYITDLSQQEQIAHYLTTRIFETLSKDKKRIVQAISLMRKPVPAHVLACVLEISELSLLLQKMGSQHIIEAKVGGSYFLHSLLKTYFEATIDSHELIPIHRKLAECFNHHRDFIEAAYHFIKAHLPDNAILVVMRNIDALVNMGHAPSTLELLDTVPEKEVPAILLADVHQVKGNLYRAIGQFVQSITEFESAEQQCSRSGNKFAQTEALCGLAETQRMQGSYEATLSAYSKADELAKSTDNLRSRVQAQCGIGRVLRLTGSLQAALAAYEQAQSDSQNLSDERSKAEIAWGLGRTVILLGKNREALEHFQSAYGFSLSAADTYRQAEALWGIGEVYRRIGNYPEAIKTYTSVQNLVREFGTPYGLAWTLIGIGETSRLMGNFDRATKVYQMAQRLCGDIGDKYGLAAAFLGLAEVARASQELNSAMALAEKARGLALSISHRLETTHASLSILEAQRLQGNDIPDGYTEVLQEYEVVGCTWGIIHSLIGRALFRSKTVEHDAKDDLTNALSLSPALEWPVENLLIVNLLDKIDPTEIHPLNFP